MARPSRLLAALASDAAVPADADLLSRFAGQRDVGAFELLVFRHAPLVLRACRVVLRDHHAAEDAAQAVFLALARQARVVRGDTLPGWLFRVSRRVAGRLARRQPPAAAADLDALPAPATAPAPDPADVRLLHDELARLPAAYRDPLLLLYFEGLTRDETARRLGWPSGTVAGRVARAKARLADRLARRGVVLGALVVTAEAVPPGFAGATAEAAVAYAVGSAQGVPAGVAGLATREVRRTAMTRVAKLVGLVLACGAVALGLGEVPGGAAPVEPHPTPPSAAAKDPPDGAVKDLPDGAVVRLGSAALRHPDTLTDLRFTADGRHLLTYGHGKLRRWGAKTGEAVPDPAKDVSVQFGTTLLGPAAATVVAPHVDRDPPRMSVREYDLATGRHSDLFPLPDRRPGGHYGAQQFALSADGVLLAEGWGKEAFVWNLRAKAVRHHLAFPTDQTFQYRFTPDGRHLLTAAGNERVVRVWDMQSGKPVRVLTWDGQGIGGVGGLAVSPDGRWVAAAGNAHLHKTGAELAAWELVGGGPPLVVILPDGVALGGALAFGPGGALYAVSQPPESGAGRVVTRWDVATGRRVGRWAGPDPGRYGMATAAVSPDGGTLAVGTHGGVVRLYDTRTGDEPVRPPALASEVIGLSFDAAGTEVRAVAADGSAATYYAATGATRTRRGPPVSLPAPGASMPVVASPDGRWVMTYALNPDGPYPPWGADLRDATTGARKYGLGVDGRVKGLIPIPGGTLLAGLIEVNGWLDARVWDTATGQALPRFGLLIDRDRGRYAVSPDGATFLVVDEGEAIGYDPATGRRRFSWKPAHRDVLGVLPPPADRGWGAVRAVAGSPDGKTAAVAVGGDVFADAAKRADAIVLVEAQSGKVIRRARNPETPTTWLVFSPDGGRLAGPRCVWDAATLTEVRRFPAKPEVSTAAFSPDGKRVATGHVNGTAVVWPVGGE